MDPRFFNLMAFKPNRTQVAGRPSWLSLKQLKASPKCERTWVGGLNHPRGLLGRRSLWILTLIAFVGPRPLMAHPVSFRGSTGIMVEQSPMMSSIEINYSFRHWWALGAWHIRRPDSDGNRFANLATFNFLLRRWNTDGHQANIYAMVGGGESRLDGDLRGVGFSSLQFDIENRSLYFLARHSEMLTPQNRVMRQTVLRTGLAPYIDPYDGIHSWILLEWQEWQFLGSQVASDITPFLRLFYRNVLVEFGQSINGVTRFNLITHF